MNRSTDITSFSSHRQHLREHLDRVRSTGRPLFITTHGETDAVLLSPKAFDELVEKAEFAQSLELIDRSMEQVETGEGRSLKEAIAEIAANLDQR